MLGESDRQDNGIDDNGGVYGCAKASPYFMGVPHGKLGEELFGEQMDAVLP
jgi:hypothetical protein